jgi:hypothetical protein
MVLIPGLFSLALLTGLACIAYKKTLLGSFILTCCALFVLLVSLTIWNFEQRQAALLERSVPSTTLAIQSDLGDFQTHYNGLPNHRALLIRHRADFLLDWNGTQLRGKAPRNVVDLNKTDDREFKYSISGFTDPQGLKSFLAEAFQCGQLDREASFVSGEFAFQYKTNTSGAIDINVTKNPQGISAVESEAHTAMKRR